MAEAEPEDKDRLRQRRRDGQIEIKGLSKKGAASRQRIVRRKRWRKGKRGGA